MMYGAQVWAVQDNGEQVASSLLKPLKAVQKKCLQQITGGYKRTPTAALEREVQVPLLDLYTDTIALQRASAMKHRPTNQNIMEITNGIWNQSANDHQTPNVAWLQRQHQGNSRPPTGLERLCKRAAARENEVIEWEEARQR